MMTSGGNSGGAVDALALLTAAEPPPQPVAVASEPAPPVAPLGLRPALASGGRGLVIVLALVQMMDYLDSSALATLAPDIQRTLHLSDTAFNAVISVQAAVFVLGAVPLGLLADRSRRRLLVAGAAAGVAALATVATGAARGLGPLLLARIANEAGQSAILPVHNALLADGYPLRARARIFGLHGAAAPIGTLLGPLVAGGVVALVGGTAAWRWVFVLCAVPSLVLALLVTRLREPVRGAAEIAELCSTDADPSAETAAPVSLQSAAARMLAVPTFRRLFLAVGVLGFVLIAVPTSFSLYLDRAFRLSTGQRGLVIALVEIGAVAGVLLGGALTDRFLTTRPERALHLMAATTALFGVLFPLALALPSLPLVVIGVVLAKGLQSIGIVPVYGLVAGLAPYRLRSSAFTLLGLSIFLLGGFAGALLTGVISDAHGPQFALTVVVVPACLISALVARSATGTVAADLSATAADLLEERDEAVRRSAGGVVPALQVRDLHVAYGSTKVLTGIDLDVQAGEVVALLGTNGAGKSTLLRALTGLTPTGRGTVRLDGRDITFSDPADRVAGGMVHLAGGKAVFATMSVRENLLVGTHTYAWEAARVRDQVAAVLLRFPVLAERLDQSAGSLSGGEQQLLAMAKALLLSPRVLLIDELSLGLAPAVVQDLVVVLAELRAGGVTVVLVEQSVNLALSLADRAVFLEKGTVQYDGPAAGLLERTDLLRAVFLAADGPALPVSLRTQPATR